MLPLVKIFWAICRLQVGPQALPTSQYLLIITVIAGIIVDSAATAILIPALSSVELVLIVSVYNAALLVSVYILLRLIAYHERALQTLTALAGTGLFISLVLLPGLMFINMAEEAMQSFALFILIDNIWRIAVYAHIFRHALSISLLMAMILSLSYLLWGIFIADILLPETVK